VAVIVQQRTNEDVEEIMIGCCMKHRPFSLGEGIRGMRPLNKEISVQVSDTTMLIKEI
jgi:hypothetical protein